ncbi:MAG: hypothetical protein K6F73_04765 [Lachnospiraceae bacterium]|nr:hypothetical protein [Lachnospiraceae bacterium]
MSKNHKRAKVLTLIPLIVFALSVICEGALTINYFRTGSDVAAIAVIFLGTMTAILTTLPCLIMSVLGTVYAARAKSEGEAASRKFFVLGVIEIAIYVLGVFGALISFLITVIAAS